MQKITNKTPRIDFLVQDLLLSVPEPFKLGDVLETEGEVSSVNQTYRENIRNNCAKAIKAIKEAEKDPAKALEAAQAAIDKYCSEYQFGVRTGGGRSADPVMTVALGIAKKLVRDKWRKQGKKTSDYSAADLTAAAKKVINANAQILDYAKKEVAAKQNLAGRDLKIEV